MKLRRPSLIVLFLAAGYVAIVGCGDEDGTAVSDATDAGNDVSLDTSAPDTSVADTSTPPADARADGTSPELTGSPCKAASECYGAIDGAALQGGEAVCLDKTPEGYCTHKCTTDEDCCAVPGECKTGLKQVCASFENQADKFCFLSCEAEDINAATDGGFSDAGIGGDDYCQGNISADWGCRSTGGGQANRKVCFPSAPPGDGGAGDASDAADADGG